MVGSYPRVKESRKWASIDVCAVLKAHTHHLQVVSEKPAQLPGIRGLIS